MVLLACGYTEESERVVTREMGVEMAAIYSAEYFDTEELEQAKESLVGTMINSRLIGEGPGSSGFMNDSIRLTS